MPDPKAKLPKASKAEVKPPAGYVLNNPADMSTVPAFLKQGVDLGKISQVNTDPQTISESMAVAAVNPANPYQINVFKPHAHLYDGDVRNHELTHTYQMTRNPNIGAVAKEQAYHPEDPQNVDDYDYGGEDGLRAAIKARKSISDFGYEQQANIVRDYKSKQDDYLAKVKAGKASPADLRKMYETHQAYHPFVRQMAAMPDEKQNLNPSALDLLRNRNIPTLDLKTEAPGLPSYDTPGLGVAPADPLLGGQSVPIGKTKRFKSGKIGVWDGHGWRAK